MVSHKPHPDGRFTGNVRSFLKAVGAALVIVLAGPVHAQDYPDGKTIKLVVPWPAGGATDAAGRILAEHLGKRLNTTVIVENRGGANGRIGAQYVASARPDGYTLLVASAETHAINPYVFSKLPYDPLKDFVAVAPFAINPFTVAARPGLPANSVKEMIALAKASPGKLTFASWGIGSTAQIAMEMLKSQYEFEMLHVPFVGAAPATAALLAGQVDLMILPAANANALRQKIKVYAMTTKDRFFLMPDIPSLQELGFEGIDIANWFGVVAPANTPDTIVRRLAAEVVAIVRAPDAQAQFKALGVDVYPPMSQPDFQRFVQSEGLRWGNVIRKANITLE